MGVGPYRYVPRDASMTSETFYCKRGVNQMFLQTSHIFNPTSYADDLSYNPDMDVYPIAIHCVIDEGPEENRQSHTTICVIDHHSDGTYGLRALKQKIFVDGLCYLLQEIYGIENKNITKVRLSQASGGRINSEYFHFRQILTTTVMITQANALFVWATHATH